MANLLKLTFSEHCDVYRVHQQAWSRLRIDHSSLYTTPSTVDQCQHLSSAVKIRVNLERTVLD